MEVAVCAICVFCVALSAVVNICVALSAVVNICVCVAIRANTVELCLAPCQLLNFLVPIYVLFWVLSTVFFLFGDGIC